jgi:hypothetical protein
LFYKLSFVLLFAANAAMTNSFLHKLNATKQQHDMGRG